MTDREKVIEGLQKCAAIHQGFVCESCEYPGDDCAIDDAIAMLKAQEPVRPIIEKNISTGECEDPWGRLFFCGACGKRINEKYNPDEDDKYCKHCGQAVKWDG